MDNKRIAWKCKIGVVDGVEIPPGADLPMRQAVQKAFLEITGVDEEACFSGWGAEFTPAELHCIDEDKYPPPPAEGPAPVAAEGANWDFCIRTLNASQPCNCAPPYLLAKVETLEAANGRMAEVVRQLQSASWRIADALRSHPQGAGARREAVDLGAMYQEAFIAGAWNHATFHGIDNASAREAWEKAAPRWAATLEEGKAGEAQEKEVAAASSWLVEKANAITVSAHEVNVVEAHEGEAQAAEAPAGQRVPSGLIREWLADKPEAPLGGAVPPGWVWNLCHDLLDARRQVVELITLTAEDPEAMARLALPASPRPDLEAAEGVEGAKVVWEGSYGMVRIALDGLRGRLYGTPDRRELWRLLAHLDHPITWATGEFTQEFAFYNMLVAWTPEQCREFYAMLSRRPDFNPVTPPAPETRKAGET